MHRDRKLLLLDNGSLEPAATLSLRRIAAQLSAALGREVAAVSLLHSHKVPAELLGGRPAETFEAFVKRGLADGCTEYDVLPLFFGPSGAVTEYLPARVEHLRRSHPALSVRVAPCLAESLFPGDDSLLAILEENLNGCLAEVLIGGDLAASTQVLLVDHGSPKPEVTAVRDLLAHQLDQRLRGRVAAVTPASMERRPEADYDFNEPLLERALANLPPHITQVVLSMLFVSPGRHAGPGGDVFQICEAAASRRPGLRVSISPLVGEHPGLVALLVQRARHCLQLS